jgi:hypothetical protein
MGTLKQASTFARKAKEIHCGPLENTCASEAIAEVNRAKAKAKLATDEEAAR